jgi:hypothetical protein
MGHAVAVSLLLLLIESRGVWGHPSALLIMVTISVTGPGQLGPRVSQMPLAPSDYVASWRPVSAASHALEGLICHVRFYMLESSELV